MGPLEYSHFSFDQMADDIKNHGCVNCFIIGRSGSGKTSVMKHIFCELADRGVVFDIVMALVMLRTEQANLDCIVPPQHYIQVSGDYGKNDKDLVTRSFKTFADQIGDSDNDVLVYEDKKRFFAVITDDLAELNCNFKSSIIKSRHTNVSCIFVLHDLIHISKVMRDSPYMYMFITSKLNTNNRSCANDYPGLDTIMNNKDLEQFMEKRGNIIVLAKSTSKDGSSTFSFDSRVERPPIVFKSHYHGKNMLIKKIKQFTEKELNKLAEDTEHS